jgi:hypothetical protein
MLSRVEFQGSKTIRATYEWFLTNGGMNRYARPMLALLPGLEALCEGLSVWGMTSHADLWLLPDKTPETPHLVLIRAIGEGYRVGYRPQGRKRTQFLEESDCTTPEEALGLIAVAMERSGGWPTSPRPRSAA